MSHIILDIKTAARRLKLSGRLPESLVQAIRGIGKTKLPATGKSARQLEAEKQARMDKARHDGEAAAATMPCQFLR